MLQLVELVRYVQLKSTLMAFVDVATQGNLAFRSARNVQVTNFSPLTATSRDINIYLYNSICFNSNYVIISHDIVRNSDDVRLCRFSLHQETH